MKLEILFRVKFFQKKIDFNSNSSCENHIWFQVKSSSSHQKNNIDSNSKSNLVPMKFLLT
jgi:hypothetical protein